MTLIYCLLDLSCGEDNVISLYFLGFSVNGSICPVCCVSDTVVNCLGKQLAIHLGVVVILLLNVMGVLSVGTDALLDGLYMVFQRMCVLCLWSQCAYINVPSISFVCVYVCRRLSHYLGV